LLDEVADSRQLECLTTEIETTWRVPVLGSLPAAAEFRHMMETPPSSEEPRSDLLRALGDYLTRSWCPDRISRLWDAKSLPAVDGKLLQVPPATLRLTVAVAFDKAFNHYFPCALDMLEARGATIVDFSPLIGIYLAMHMIIILIALMGGRVIPFFIGRTTQTQITPPHSALETAGFICLILWSLSSLILGSNEITAILAGLAALFQLFRLKAWHVKKLWSVPMLWILYLGYSWIVIGLLLQVLRLFNPLMTSLSIHAFTAGAIGMVTMGMMARVSLGHTGRDINHNKLLLTAFLLITATPVIRSLLPATIPSLYQVAVIVSAILWTVAFVLFTLAMIPVLTKARIDGRDG